MKKTLQKRYKGFILTSTETQSSITAAHASLLHRIPALKISSVGGTLPFRVEGMLEGMPFEFNYRPGHAILRVGGDIPLKSLYESNLSYTEDDNFLSNAGLEDLFVTLVKDLAPAPMWWEFSGICLGKVSGYKVGDTTVEGGWGHNSDEAWKAMHYNYSLIEDSETLDESISAYGLIKETLSVDDRKYPASAPDFTVLY